MKRLFIFITLLASLAMISACTNFSNSVDPVIDQVPDDRLNDPGQVNFLIIGVEQRFARAQANVMVLASGLSDEFFFDQRVPNATFPQFNDIDLGDITFDNNSVDGAYNPLGELRFFADDLVRRIGTITFSDAALQKKGLYTGYLFGGIARYLYAAYFGLNPTEGGGVIDNGPFIPSAQMYDLALEKLQLALTNAPSPADARVVNSIIARIHLIRGNFANARTAATAGMVQGDAAFQGKFSTLSTNYYWQQAGLGRPQFVADARFLAYTTADPKEKNRIVLSPITGNDAAKTVFQRQAKYATESTPIDFMSWQENELMLAELDVRDGNTGAALPRVNAVRTSHGLDPLTTIDLDGIYVERDKELFVTGTRLLDERRFNRFHLATDKWQFLPITDDERNNNPNL
jgi:starch-binding outer membrane protein, SusD/RagB family